MSDDIGAPAAGSVNFLTNEIIIYGVDLRQTIKGSAVANPSTVNGAILPFDNKDFGVRIGIASTITKTDQQANDAFFIAAYGYAYEGQCYRFDRVRILVVESTARMTGPFFADGCGFGDGAQHNPVPNPPPPPPAQGEPQVHRGQYYMWRVSALSPVTEMTIQRDTFQSLVLEANLPGRRTPNTYEGQMRMAHRGGRIGAP